MMSEKACVWSVNKQGGAKTNGLTSIVSDLCTNSVCKGTRKRDMKGGKKSAHKKSQSFRKKSAKTGGKSSRLIFETKPRMNRTRNIRI